MTISLDTIFTKQTSRSCGSCSLCCKLLPVKDLNKPALKRCQHQRHDGDGCCAIYETRPLSCKLWSCAWLMRADTKDLSRPDRSHVVIDTMPDVIGCNDDGNEFDVEVIQVWVDPLHKDAWKHPTLLDYFERRCAEKKKEGSKLAILIRYGSNDGFVVFPPSLTGGKDFIIHPSEGTWTEEETLAKMNRLMTL